MKRTPLKRKTPLCAKPKVSKPRPAMRKKKSSVAAAERVQRAALAARSRGRCEMDVAELGFGPGVRWIRCSARAQDPAHVYTRPKCGAARDTVDAVIHACRDCHERSEGNLGANGVRVPLRYAQAAWDAILAHSRLGVGATITERLADRERIHTGSIGPRPTLGVGVYCDETVMGRVG